MINKTEKTKHQKIKPCNTLLDEEHKKIVRIGNKSHELVQYSFRTFMEMYANGIDFVEEADYYFKKRLASTEQGAYFKGLKHAILNIFSGTCCFLKLKVWMDYDWKGILAGKDKNKSEIEIKKNDFRTISFNEILDKLCKKDKIIPLEIEYKLKTLSKVRNTIEHYGFPVLSSKSQKEFIQQHEGYTKATMDCYQFAVNFVEQHILAYLLADSAILSNVVENSNQLIKSDQNRDKVQQGCDKIRELCDSTHKQYKQGYSKLPSFKT